MSRDAGMGMGGKTGGSSSSGGNTGNGGNNRESRATNQYDKPSNPYGGGSGGVQSNVTTTSKVGTKDPTKQYDKPTRTITVANPHTKTGFYTTEVKVGPSASAKQDVNEFRKQAQYAISPMTDPKNKAIAMGLSLLMPGLGTVFSNYKTSTGLGYSASNAFNNITGKATDFLSKFTSGTAPTNNDDTKGGGDGISDTVKQQVIDNILNVQKAAGVPKSQLITNYWYSSLGNTSPSGFTFSFQKQLNEAKAKQNIILNNSSSVGQLAVNQSPFFDFLKTRSLNKGIL